MLCATFAMPVSGRVNDLQWCERRERASGVWWWWLRAISRWRLAGRLWVVKNDRKRTIGILSQSAQVKKCIDRRHDFLQRVHVLVYHLCMRCAKRQIPLRVCAPACRLHRHVADPVHRLHHFACLPFPCHPTRRRQSVRGMLPVSILVGMLAWRFDKFHRSRIGRSECWSKAISWVCEVRQSKDVDVTDVQTTSDSWPKVGSCGRSAPGYIWWKVMNFWIWGTFRDVLGCLFHIFPLAASPQMEMELVEGPRAGPDGHSSGWTETSHFVFKRIIHRFGRFLWCEATFLTFGWGSDDGWQSTLLKT